MPPKPNPRTPVTHFLCLPLITPTSRPCLSKSLQEFKITALCPLATTAPTPTPNSARLAHATTDGSNARIDERAIRPLGTLHLTIGVMSLQTQERVDEVGEMLQGLDLGAMLNGDCGPESLGTSTTANDRTDTKRTGSSANSNFAEITARESVAPPPLVVSLRGLKSMQEPEKTSVLYIEPWDSTNRLEGFCGRLKEVFGSAGLMVEDERALKLHVTVVNTVYANRGPRRRKKTPEDGHAGHGLMANGEGRQDERAPPLRERGTRHFDARGLLERFGEYEWMGEMRLERVAVCRMGSEKIRNAEGEVVDERYKEVFGRTLP